MMADATQQSLAELARTVATAYNADLILYSGGISEAGFGRLVEVVLENKDRPNVILIMRTFGGSANAAYYHPGTATVQPILPHTNQCDENPAKAESRLKASRSRFST